MKLALLSFSGLALALATGVSVQDARASAQTEHYTNKDALTGRTLRVALARVANDVNPPCSIPLDLTAHKARYETLRDGIQSHADKIDLLLAEDGIARQRARVRYDCAQFAAQFESETYSAVVSDSISDQLDRLEELLKNRPDYGEVTFTGPYSEADVQRGGPVREAVIVTAGHIYDPCASASEELAPLVKRYTDLKASLGTHAQRIDFAIGEADHSYMMSLIDIACPEPGSQQSQQQAQTMAQNGESALNRLERAMASAYPSED